MIKIALAPTTCHKTGVCQGVCHRVPTCVQISKVASGVGPAHISERVLGVCHRVPTACLIARVQIRRPNRRVLKIGFFCWGLGAFWSREGWLKLHLLAGGVVEN